VTHVTGANLDVGMAPSPLAPPDVMVKDGSFCCCCDEEAFVMMEVVVPRPAGLE